MTTTIPLLIGIAVLLFLSGFFSSSETALMSLSRTELKRMSQGSPNERTVYRLLLNPQQLLSTILLGNMFVNVLLASLFASLLAHTLAPAEGYGPLEKLVERCFSHASPAEIKRAGNILNSVLNIAIVTPLLMIFGEHTPKVLAYSQAQTISKLAAEPLSCLCLLLTPLNFIMKIAAKTVLFILGQGDSDAWQAMTTDELLATLSVSKETGATDDNEQTILARVVQMGDISIREVMTHRMDVIAISDTMTLRQAYAFAGIRHHSWYPIYHDTIDDIWGMLSLADFPQWCLTDAMDKPLAQFLNKAIQDSPVFQPHYIPEFAHVDKVLHTMREQAFSVIVVVDEHGGTSGMATLNDLVEEMLGRFAGSDVDEDALTYRPDGTILADGRAHLRTLQKVLGDSFSNEELDAESLGGLIMERLGHIPKNGEELQIEDGPLLRVKRIAARRIRSVEITPQDVLAKRSAATQEIAIP